MDQTSKQSNSQSSNQSNSQSSNQSGSLSRSSSYGRSDMSACDSDSQAHNILQDNLHEVESEIVIIKADETRDRNTITELNAQMIDIQDTDERKQIQEQILKLTTMLPQYLSHKIALRAERKGICEHLAALYLEANQSHKSLQHKRNFRLSKHAIVSARVMSSLSKPCSLSAHSVFFIDSMLYHCRVGFD